MTQEKYSAACFSINGFRFRFRFRFLFLLLVLFGQSGFSFVKHSEQKDRPSLDDSDLSWQIPLSLPKGPIRSVVAANEMIRVKIFPHHRNFPPHGLDVEQDRILFRSERPCNVFEGIEDKAERKDRLITQVSTLDIHAANLTVPIWLDCIKPVKLVRGEDSQNFEYLGQLYVKRTVDEAGKYSLQVINLVDIETYLRGVVPAEVYSNWSPEALKSQAVAARTYAFYHMTYARYYTRAKLGYDVDDTVYYQAYTGLSNITPATDRAIEATKHQIITYQKHLIPAYYHADSGGWTADPKAIWNKAIPFCQQKKEPFDHKKFLTPWRRPISIFELGRNLKELGLVKNAKGIVRVQPAPEEKTASGRVRAVVVEMKDGSSKLVSVYQLRKFMQLDSNKFTVEVKGIGDEMMVEFKGQGQGHGIGMSQMGAQILASELSWSYQRILAFYYSNTNLCSVASRGADNEQKLPNCKIVRAKLFTDSQS